MTKRSLVALSILFKEKKLM